VWRDWLGRRSWQTGHVRQIILTNAHVEKQRGDQKPLIGGVLLTAFSPPPGLVSDDTSFAAEGRWTDGSNVRFRDGKPQVIGGWSTTGRAALLGTCRSLHAWTIGNVFYCAMGTTARLYVETGGALYDITPAADIAETGLWSFANYGNDLLAQSAGGTIYRWQGDTGADAGALPNAPYYVGAGILVTPQRQVLALFANEALSGIVNPMCIRGSDLEDPTAWDSMATNNAFEHILDGPGRIVAGAIVGDHVVIWTDTALFLGTFLGDPGQTYRFEKIAADCGLYCQTAAVIVDQRAYWYGSDGRFWTWTVGMLPEHVECPLLKDLNDNLNRTRDTNLSRMFATPVSRHGEIWWFYPRGGSAECTNYVAFSTRDVAWFKGALARTAFLDDPLIQRMLAPGGAAQIKITNCIGVDAAGIGYFHEYGSNANGAALDWFIQSGDQSIEQSGRRMLVRGIVPDFKDQLGNISLTLSCRDRPQSAAVVKGPYTLTPTTTKKDFRASGRILAVKFSGGAATGSFMRLGKVLFDVVPAGQR
jgi:hypothetical protein